MRCHAWIAWNICPIPNKWLEGYSVCEPFKSNKKPNVFAREKAEGGIPINSVSRSSWKVFWIRFSCGQQPQQRDCKTLTWFLGFQRVPKVSLVRIARRLRWQACLRWNACLHRREKSSSIGNRRVGIIIHGAVLNNERSMSGYWRDDCSAVQGKLCLTKSVRQQSNRMWDYNLIRDKIRLAQ